MNAGSKKDVSLDPSETGNEILRGGEEKVDNFRARRFTDSTVDTAARFSDSGTPSLSMNAWIENLEHKY